MLCGVGFPLLKDGIELLTGPSETLFSCPKAFQAEFPWNSGVAVCVMPRWIVGATILDAVLWLLYIIKMYKRESRW